MYCMIRYVTYGTCALLCIIWSLKMCVPYERCDRAKYDVRSLDWLMVDVMYDYVCDLWDDLKLYDLWRGVWLMKYVTVHSMIWDVLCELWQMLICKMYDYVCDLWSMYFLTVWSVKMCVCDLWKMWTFTVL